jgi:hypothetical protein
VCDRPVHTQVSILYGYRIGEKQLGSVHPRYKFITNVLVLSTILQAYAQDNQ